MADNYDNCRVERQLTEIEIPIMDQILNNPNKSMTTIQWGPSYFDTYNDLKIVYQDNLDRYIHEFNYVYSFRFNPEVPEDLTWINVNDSRLTLGKVLEGTEAEKQMQILCKWVGDGTLGELGVTYLPVGMSSYNANKYIESV